MFAEPVSWTLGIIIACIALAPLYAFADEPKVKPNEHPRLFFTKADVPELRRRAQTPEGKQIVANLQELLKKQVPLEQSQSGETRYAGLWAAGQAFAYIVSGKQADADAAMQRTRAIVDAPVINMPELRRGTRYMGAAIAYDLCYDAWPRDFREKTAVYLAARADGLLTRNEGVKGDNPAAQSNHNVEGRTQMGVIALAIMGDTGAGDAMPAIIAAARKDLDGWLRVGIGDGGFGTEGEAFTLNCLNWGVFQFAAAHAHVLGEPATRDESLDRILPLVMMRIVNQDMPYHGPEVSKWDGCDIYGSAFWAMGAALATEPLRPAFRTLYDARFGPKSSSPFKIQNPAEAIYLLRYYPWGVEARPLEDVLPKTAQDKQKGFFVFRNAYKDAGDCLATVYLHREVVGSSWQCEPSIRVWGLGGRWLSFDPSRKTLGTRGRGAELLHAALLKDGSGAVTAKADAGLFAFAVDYSGTAGVPAIYVFVDDIDKPLTVTAGGKITVADDRSFTLSNDTAATLHATLFAPADAKLTADKNILTLPGKSCLVMTLQAGDAPAAAAEGDTFRIGKQVIRWQDQKIEIGAK